jgi:excinuclease ABC subunit C
LERLGIINQPLASIAKQQEILYLLGREDDPVVLDHHSPALHLIQQIRDEAHRFAVTFHRARRGKRELASELLDIAGIGEKTANKLLSHFGNLSAMQNLSAEELGQVVNSAQAERIVEYFSRLPKDD